MEKRKDVDPKMDLKKGKKASPEGTQPERIGANMPQVGKEPTGKEAAKKSTIGMG